MSLHGGLRINHHALDNVHQNELEINSLDVDSPHCSWQIGPRLKSCALPVAPPPCCIGGVRNSHHRSFVREEDPELSSIHRLCALPVRRGASRHQILSPMEKHLPPAKERSLLTVRMCEERLPSSWRRRRVVATGSATPSSPPRPPPWAPPPAPYARAV